MERDMERGGGVPRRKSGGEGDEHWLENLEHGGRRALDPEDLDDLHDLDDDQGLLDGETDDLEDEAEEDEDLSR
jgi:hypothetical protein